MGERLRDVRCIHMEVEFFEIYRGQALFGDVHALLQKRGFRLAGFTSYSRFAADALYLRDDIPLGQAVTARSFPYLARNLRKMRLHRFVRAMRRMVGLPAWREERRAA
jgi:hypothetical protein